MDNFLAVLSSFFKWLLVSTTQVSVLICIVLGIKAIIRGRLAVRWHYWLWLIVLVRMVMPWAPRADFSVFTPIWRAGGSIVKEHFTETAQVVRPDDTTAEVSQAIAPETGMGPEGKAQISAITTAPQTPQEASAKSGLSVIDLLSVLWLAVAATLGVLALACNFRLWRIVKSQRPVTEGKILDLLEDCKAEMGIQTILGVIVTERIKSPALFGVVRPRLLLPEGTIEALTHEELRYVFLHELGHLKRRDIYLGWLMVILQAVHWFNPLVWLAFHRMRVDRELACDSLVLSTRRADEPERYGTTIINLLRQLSQVSYVPGIAGILENKSELKRRITMIGQFKRGSYRWSAVAAIFLAVLGCVVLTNAQEATQTQEKDVKTMAEEFVGLLVKGDFSGAVEGFDATMKKTLPAEKLAQTWRTTTGQAGLFKQQLGTRLEKFLGSEIAFVTCEFEKGPMDVKVVYDSDKKVSGLWFVPTPENVLKEYRGEEKKKPAVLQRIGPAELARDDGSSEGRNSIAGGGHAVLFETPGGGGIVKSVRIYGSRYGYDAPPRENFHVWLCDKDLKVIKDFAFPYSRFVKGNPKWVSLRVDPTPVPESFIVCAGFNPERTKGVYVHYDGSSSGNSFVALPGQERRVFNRGEWMIRAVVSTGASEPKQTAPAILATSPEAFANNIPAELTKITVTFDQPMMDGSWSWTGGGDTFPQMTGRPYYDQSKTTCTMPVKLEPGKVYWVGINSPSHRNFKTPARQSAPWYIILFATRTADGEPTPIPEDRLARAKQINAAAGRLAPSTSAGTDGESQHQVQQRTDMNSRRQAEELAVEGWRLWRERKLIQSEEKFKEAIEKDPSNDNAYQGLGWAQLNQGKKLSAKDSFEKCIAINPNNAAALNGLGWIAHGAGEKDEAIKWWEKAVAAAPGATASLSGLTKVYMERKDYANAVKYYRMWVDADPSSAEAKSGLKEAQSALENR